MVDNCSKWPTTFFDTQKVEFPQCWRHLILTSTLFLYITLFGGIKLRRLFSKPKTKPKFSLAHLSIFLAFFITTV